MAGQAEPKGWLGRAPGLLWTHLPSEHPGPRHPYHTHKFLGGGAVPVRDMPRYCARSRCLMDACQSSGSKTAFVS